MLAPSGACATWLTIDEVFVRRPGAAELDQGVLTSALASATDLIFAASGRQFSGTCLAVVRPIAAPIGWSPATWASYWASLSGTGWYSSWGLCRGDDHSGCQIYGGIELPGYPIQDIVQVTVDGGVLDPNAYTVVDYRRLLRTDGSGWPTCQDWRLPTTEIGTFEVQYHYGMNPPESGKNAVAIMTEKLALAQSGKNSGLPSRLSNLASANRQGVSLSFVDPMQFLDKGRTGVYEVDLFLAQYNPGGQKRPALVYSPDRGSSHIY